MVTNTARLLMSILEVLLLKYLLLIPISSRVVGTPHKC